MFTAGYSPLVRPPMSEQLIIGVDLGTSSAKAAAYDLNGGKVASAEVSYPTYSSANGLVEQRPDDWLAAVGDALRSLAVALGNRVRAVAAIGLSAHAPAIVPVRADGTPLLHRVPIWGDTRCIDVGQILLDTIGIDRAWNGPGMVLTAHYPRLAWLIEHAPQVIEQACWLLAPKDLLGLWLTGVARSDPSSGSGAAAWRTDILFACGIAATMLPSLVEPTALTGYLLPQVAQSLGLIPNLPIVTGTNDGAAAAVATGALSTDDIIITLGTNGVIRRVSDAPPPGQYRVAHGVFCWPYVDNLWIVGGHTRVGARALTWLAELLGVTTQDIIDIAATAEPGAGGITCLPYFMGQGTPVDDARVSASLHGLTLNTDHANLCRAVIEGLVFALDDVLQSLPAPTADHIHYRVTGGGARSQLWVQILADILEKPIYTFSSQSALGAALIASVGVDLYPSVGVAVQAMVRPDQILHPNPILRDSYRASKARYRNLRDTLHQSSS